MTILSINQLSKAYGNIQAVDKLSMVVERGTILGILGPNGSGKTTTLGMILDVIHSDSGTFKWFNGEYGLYHRKQIGATLETPNFYPYLNADQNLEIVAQIKGVKQNGFDDILELIGLKARRKSKFKTYSLGMKQRLAIGATLIGDPEVLIFDEPTNGLDPQGIAEIRDLLINLASTGKTVIMASHILDEVEKICTHVAILKKGKLLAMGPVGFILNNDRFAELATENMLELRNWLQSWIEPTFIKEMNGYLECKLPEGYTAAQINKLAFENGLILTYLKVRSRKLEEEFIELTKTLAGDE
ncbi:MAG TPA: ATP-binding cassette domain-containing protein [Saprospiraceae bacterium]|nr:ATP-binding cassette domain-containing protein [Saprospiraceae bacterium]